MPCSEPRNSAFIHLRVLPWIAANRAKRKKLFGVPLGSAQIDVKYPLRVVSPTKRAPQNRSVGRSPGSRTTPKAKPTSAPAAALPAARRRGRLGGRPKSLTEADLKKARALLRSGDYTKGQGADELKVARHTLWRALSREAAKG